MYKVIFAKYGLPKKILSDSGGNFISDKFRMFCNILNREKVFSSSYHHQCNGQVEACIKLVKFTIMKCFNTIGDPHLALL